MDEEKWLCVCEMRNQEWMRVEGRRGMGFIYTRSSYYLRFEMNKENYNGIVCEGG